RHDSIAPAQERDRAQLESSQPTSLQAQLRGRAGITRPNDGGLGKQSSQILLGTNSVHTVVLVYGVLINSADLGLAMYQDLPL
ncbi:TonB-dependent vitamin B12 receptor, partial [Stenotrophomonas maltophilia]